MRRTVGLAVAIRDRDPGGGCRMGTSPDTSVIDADHRVWGVPNLFVCDGSVMPTQGSANPALTIMALASRLGQRLAAKRVGSLCG
jgi:choline dehydrogenase-like flavoprotein